MTEETQEAIKPWYKQPWLWFILTPLFAVFIYGFTFLYLSIVTMDGVVKDDYYKKVRGYEVNSSKNQTALNLNIQGNLKLDEVTGDISLQLSGDFEQEPEFISLEIVHPTHQKYDQKITLKALGSQGIYSGSMTAKLKGKRYLYIAPASEDWSLQKEILPPYEQRQITLQPKVK